MDFRLEMKDPRDAGKVGLGLESKSRSGRRGPGDDEAPPNSTGVSSISGDFRLTPIPDACHPLAFFCVDFWPSPLSTTLSLFWHWLKTRQILWLNSIISSRRFHNCRMSWMHSVFTPDSNRGEAGLEGTFPTGEVTGRSVSEGRVTSSAAADAWPWPPELSMTSGLSTILGFGFTVATFFRGLT